MTERSSQYQKQGFLAMPSIVSQDEVDDLVVALGPLTAHARKPGLRSLMKRLPIVRQLALDSRLVALASELLGLDASPVKATLFDKSVDANWKLPLHQDTFIAVQARTDAEGFGPWSVKDGVPYVGAPAAVLSRLVALRLHLDDTPVENGALRVVPRSHLYGRLTVTAISKLKAKLGEVSCPALAGDVLAMSPLLLHASSISESPSHRRVIHIEYSAIELPHPLAWAT